MEFFNNRSGILKKLTSTYRSSAILRVDPAQQKFIIFSDHHRGDRGVTDYFNEKSYNAALGYYLERGYTLILAGDVEEFWECRPGSVLRSYPLTYELEREFHFRGRLIKILGNHDNLWNKAPVFRRYLRDLFPGIKVVDGIRLLLPARGAKGEKRREPEENEGEAESPAAETRSGSPSGENGKGDPGETEVFIAHGHQGTFLSDTFDWFGMFWLRYMARFVVHPFKRRYLTPATSYSLREEHEHVMFDWAEQINRDSERKVIFIAGHTHHPIFMSRNHIRRMTDDIELLNRTGTKKNIKLAARLRSRMEYLRADVGLNMHLFKKNHYYFNTGCCSFFDGSITGIEILKGKIRLIQWNDQSTHAERVILGTERIREI